MNLRRILKADWALFPCEVGTEWSAIVKHITTLSCLCWGLISARKTELLDSRKAFGGLRKPVMKDAA